MKKFTKLMLMIATVMMVVAGCQKSNEVIDVTLKSSGVMTAVNSWTSGNADSECRLAGGDCGFAFKIDEWDEEFGMDGAFETLESNTITILNSDGKNFDWISEYPVCKVIVKAGRGAYIYSYPDGAMHDEGLIGFQSKGISHVSFCYTEPSDLIIAVKCYYKKGENTNYGVSDGTFVFNSGWCSWLGYKSYPDTHEFFIMSPYDRIGEVDVIDGDIIITLDAGYSLLTSWVYIGTLESLTYSNLLEDGCPGFRNNEVWTQNDTALTNSEGLSYMTFDF